MDPAWSPACHIADYAYDVPRCTEPEFLAAVREICKKHRVDLIVPTIDTELIQYAEARDEFMRIGTDILISHPDFVTIARDKKKSAEICKKNGIPTPHTWEASMGSASASGLPYPLLLKPRHGSCSAGIYHIYSDKQLNTVDVRLEDNILQELCRGKEYTVNAFYTRDGRCAACVPHYRKMVRAGEVCFTETVRIPRFRNIADRLAEIFQGIFGPICLQGFENEDGEIKIFEINARFGGGYPICDRSGGTFAKWILQDLSGQAPDYHDNWKEGVRMLRYDAAIFI
jgi:carbamoyl-phosphate synthase large subunit